jgi:hypothetical protein
VIIEKDGVGRVGVNENINKPLTARDKSKFEERGEFENTLKV